MNRAILFFAIALIAIGLVGSASLNVVAFSLRSNGNRNAIPFGMMGRSSYGGMMGYGSFGGMMSPRGFGGMMGRGGFRGMMGRSGFGGMIGRGWMMNPRGGRGNVAPRNSIPQNANPLTLDQVVTRAQQYVTSLNNQDLTLTEVMEFSNHFYAEVKEKSTGVHAFEFLIDRYRGTVSPEPGPNMMWNTKYSPMTRMMGGFRARTATQNSLTPAQAKEKAQQYLDANMKGAKISDDTDAFYGYYGLHVLRDGKVIGMLSVNGNTGVVWYHTWHGAFVAEKEF